MLACASLWLGMMSTLRYLSLPVRQQVSPMPWSVPHSVGRTTSICTQGYDIHRTVAALEQYMRLWSPGCASCPLLPLRPTPSTCPCLYAFAPPHVRASAPFCPPHVRASVPSRLLAPKPLWRCVSGALCPRATLPFTLYLRREGAHVYPRRCCSLQMCPAASLGLSATRSGPGCLLLLCNGIYLPRRVCLC